MNNLHKQLEEKNKIIEKIKDYLKEYEMLNDGTLLHKINRYVATTNPHFLEEINNILNGE